MSNFEWEGASDSCISFPRLDKCEERIASLEKQLTELNALLNPDSEKAKAFIASLHPQPKQKE